MSDIWKRDSVYTRRVLSGIRGAPRAGVMSSRRVRKEVMSKSWSELTLIVGGGEVQSARVMPLAIVTIEVQIERVTSSLRSTFVTVGSIALRIARDEVVALRQGEMLFVMVEKEYFSTIGFASALRDTDTAPLL